MFTNSEARHRPGRLFIDLLYLSLDRLDLLMGQLDLLMEASDQRALDPSSPDHVGRHPQEDTDMDLSCISGKLPWIALLNSCVN